MSDLKIQWTEKEREQLLYPEAVREKSQQIYQLCLAGQTHFQLHLERKDEVAQFVVDVIRKNYPQLKIPLHSRWGHFRAQQRERVTDLIELFGSIEKKEVARRLMDLAVVSVLLDAGSGPDWKYVEEDSGQILTRSEGLAVASFHMFLRGDFSSNGEMLVDAQGLLNLKKEDLIEGFQVAENNPLVGVEGRLELMHSLGRELQKKGDVFQQYRPGGLIDTISGQFQQSIMASDLLHLVLIHFGGIWPSRLDLGGVNMGDTWVYPPLEGKTLNDELTVKSLVPFHKLSQWLTYSLIWPLEYAGIDVFKMDKLTGLPEYRNGGLMLDSGLLKLKDPQKNLEKHGPGSPLIIEWRALTVVLLDMLAVDIRNFLGLSEKSLTLGKVLEGGTWSAGRVLAQKYRQGRPPLNIDSDGTVF